ncbi:hypothetical protein HMPREF3222_03198 [Clostridium perfringens]|uniref:Uncharacterized protein n=2 Tax=Clostridium perfringens TaxID=1502 RepID=A0A133MK28_CLOPF|nr:hypothetical protein HMPREF3222_03198 [Clostridium perfringens]
MSYYGGYMNIRRARIYAKNILENSQEITGEVISSSVNSALGDSTGISGIVSKSVWGKSIQTLANKLDPCQLTEWEKQRVTNCMISAIDKVKERMNNGDKLREDDFFKENPDGKTDAEEVFESIVIASQRESQEMKQIFYGNMLANIGFISYLNADEFNFLLKVFEKLTYRQCLLLAIFKSNTLAKINRINSFLKNSNPIVGVVDSKDVILYQEIMDLYQKSLLFNDSNIIMNIKDVIPSNLFTYGMGMNILELAEIDKITEKNERLTDKHLKDLKELTKLFIKENN